MNLTTLAFLRTWVTARVLRSQRGANLVEYILIVALLAVAVVGSVTVFSRCVQARTVKTACQVQELDENVNDAQCYSDYVNS